MLTKDLLQECFSRSTAILNRQGTITGEFLGREIKLDVDLELDSYFRNYFETKTGIRVYSEESLGADPMKGKCWIIDPLDGSLNFSRGIPFFTSSISLWEDGRPLEGYVYDYSHKDLYATDGPERCFLNDREIRVSHRAHKEGLLVTGIPSGSSFDASVSVFRTGFEDFKKLRWFGCASLSLCYVASGRVEAYKENSIKIWDVAAGMAIVKAAGGSLEFDFNPDSSLNLFATNGVQ